MEILEMKPRVYQCVRCGYKTIQTTNHIGMTWSVDHFNTCPNCPPWAKYIEYGGQTFWHYVKDVE